MIEEEIIMFIGLQGSGKTFSAMEYNISQNKSVYNFSFADELRKEVYQKIGYKPINYCNFKNRLIYLDRYPSFISSILKLLFPFWKNGRELLQYYGKKRREENSYYWINKLKLKILKYEKLRRDINFEIDGNIVTIDDCRYINEVLAIKKFCAEENYKLKIIFCDYRSKFYNDKSKDSSEFLALWIRDNLKPKHGQDITIECISNCLILDKLDTIKTT